MTRVKERRDAPRHHKNGTGMKAKQDIEEVYR